MNILIAATEVAPFAKVTKLAEVTAELRSGLSALGHDVRVAIPCYRFLEDDARLNPRPVIDAVEFDWGGGSVGTVSVKVCLRDDALVYLVGGDDRFAAVRGPEEASTCDWAAYTFFTRALLEVIKVIEPRWIPDVIHVNDQRNALLPAYLRVKYAVDPILSKVATVLSIHEPRSENSSGRADLLKTGIAYVDVFEDASEGKSRPVHYFEDLYLHAYQRRNSRAMAA